MGLCKCPKRKVTNQFCFEHRVNVCEHCMVSNHPKCVVQSYCQWLKDSDYSALCALCQLDLCQDDCIRLICYHIFHQKCLDDHCKQYPSNTAPAGYTCPTCCSALFPPSNLVSPVADVLRTVLMNRPWARDGLGLPLLPFEPTDNESSRGEAISSSLKETPANYSIVNVETDTPNTFHRNEPVLYVKKTTPLLTDSASDRDENKYKRRSPLASLKRTLSTILDANSRHRRGGKFMRRNVWVTISQNSFLRQELLRYFTSPDLNSITGSFNFLQALL
uniref:Zinc finger protein-like 1 homolog n=1 Tax=Evadne anonyx TaxID=141404 RepID=A0A9N6ZE68_9CRUS|nr:EOG090X0ASS [Evadne anonyx]